VVPVSGIVLTKMDGTARGGVVLSVNNDLNIPIKFVGTGEKATDFDVFRPEEFAAALFPDS
jgi:fused signal recognition particle receptor